MEPSPASLRLSDFDYDLPADRIAQEPLPQRDACRLLVLDRATGAFRHRHFADLPVLLREGDLLVLNDTRVLPARLRGHKPTGGRVELLLTRRVAADRWLAMCHPGLRVGQEVLLPADLRAIVEEVAPDGQRAIRFDRAGADLDAALHQIGQLPIPPYVRRPIPRPEDYQTVYARDEGSVAAPTAGLHFTADLLHRLAESGIATTYLTLHVGPGTFRPIKVDDVSRHQMHAEWYRLSPEAAEQINRARDEGRRIVAVGTTVVRTLESLADDTGRVRPAAGDTDLFIVPGHRFRAIDAMITNFHLPRSTLLMLVSAFAGRELVLAAYRQAVAEGYRFYSFGDAMLIDGEESGPPP
jgi:S-adenosylmethionine:tRNA ribosyltransferase-isomerase